MSDAEIRAREDAATRAAGAYYTRLHLAYCHSNKPYRECPECKVRGWR
jgi:hypothetical protein